MLKSILIQGWKNLFLFLKLLKVVRLGVSHLSHSCTNTQRPPQHIESRSSRLVICPDLVRPVKLNTEPNDFPMKWMKAGNVIMVPSHLLKVPVHSAITWRYCCLFTVIIRIVLLKAGQACIAKIKLSLLHQSLQSVTCQTWGWISTCGRTIRKIVIQTLEPLAKVVWNTLDHISFVV